MFLRGEPMGNVRKVLQLQNGWCGPQRWFGGGKGTRSLRCERVELVHVQGRN